MNDDTSLSRRRVLAGLSTGAAALAGCLGGGDGQDDGGGGPTVTSGPTPTMTDGRLPAPVLGDPGASVTLAVYEDYACPHCADYNTNGFGELEAEFIDPGDIRYEHRDFPIPVADPGSWQAASAAREVQARHGNAAFWAYAKKLFENYGDLRGNVKPLLKELVNDLGLGGAEAIATAGVDRTHSATVRADRQMGIQRGIQGTPAFVVNGQVVTSGFGDSTISTVSSAVEDALSESA